MTATTYLVQQSDQKAFVRQLVAGGNAQPSDITAVTGGFVVDSAIFAAAFPTGYTPGAIPVVPDAPAAKEAAYDALVEPISFRMSTATVTATPSERAYAKRTLIGARMRVGGAPVTTALTAQVQHSHDSGATWSSVGSALSIAAAATTEAVQTFGTPQSQVVGDLVRVNVTSIGSGGAATGVIIDVLWAPA